MSEISIVVPIYNVENYLAQCLESIIKQTINDIEIICVNDGSTDNSLQIIQEYLSKDKRIKLIDKKNTGYGDSVNIGINAAASPYIGIIESDDFIKAEMFEELYKLMKKHKCDIVKSDWLDYWGKTDKAISYSRFSKFDCDKVINPEDEKDLLKIKPSVWSCLYRKDFLDKNNLRFLKTPSASYQDCSFAFKSIVCAKKICLTDKAYVYYRQDNPNSSVLNKRKVFCICIEYKEIEDFLNSNPILKENFASQKYQIQYRSYLWNLERIENKFRKEFIKYFSDEFSRYYELNVLDDDFYKYNKRKDLICLIKSPKKFLQKFKLKLLKLKIDKYRKKIISVRINTTKMSVRILGKEILNIE